MGYRLSKLYTRTGDQGTTGIGSGERVDKDAPRVEAIGTIDELNSAIAMVLAQKVPESVHSCLLEVQNDLFDLGGTLSNPGGEALNEKYVQRLEDMLDEFNRQLPPLEEFILPGGGPAGSACHLARSICRRAERRVVTLSKTEDGVPAVAIAYLNRLSDLLFVAARILGRTESAGEVYWRPGNSDMDRK